MQRVLTVCLFLLCACFCHAQHTQKLNLLNFQLQNATTDKEKVLALGALADFYYTFKLEKKADSIIQEQLSVAEASQDKDLMLATLFTNSVDNIGTWTSIETFDRTLDFIEKGLSYAKETGQNDYVALAYIRKAGLLRKRMATDLALEQTALAFATIGDAKKDSIRAVLNIELGDIYQAKGEALTAYRSYNAAYAIAYNMKSVPLQSEVFHRFAWLYQSLNDSIAAKNNLQKSLALNTANHYRKGVLNDFIDLARITNKKEYIDKAIALADSLQLLRELVFSKKLLFAYYMVIKQNSSLALNYLKQNTDLHQYYINQGPADYNWSMGNIYKYAGQPDTALYYYEQAEPKMQKAFSVGTRRILFKEMGDCYAALDNIPKAIYNYEQALSLAKEVRDLSFVTAMNKELSSLYAENKDFKQAYEANLAYANYKDTLQKLSAERDIALLGVEREAKKAQKDLDDEEASRLRIKNLQYWSIGSAIAAIFLALLLAGMFPISQFTIRLLSFFSFICLFEFIVLLIDSEFLEHITHGEPLKLWLIKIFLIAMLVPLQHFLEHGLTQFVGSRRLVTLRQNLSLKRWWQKIKTAPAATKDDPENDTAVL